LVDVQTRQFEVTRRFAVQRLGLRSSRPRRTRSVRGWVQVHADHVGRLDLEVRFVGDHVGVQPVRAHAVLAPDTPHGGRAPVSTSWRCTQVSSVCGTQPIFDAIDSTAAHNDGYSPWCSCTMGTARSRTSGENLFDLFMAPSSQELEPPQNPGRFIQCEVRIFVKAARRLHCAKRRSWP
jgi:hypothetical protein